MLRQLAVLNKCTTRTPQVPRRVDARVRGTARDDDRDAIAMGEGAQLLECFGALERDRSQSRVRSQERGAVRVNAEMTICREAARDAPNSSCEGVARVWNDGAAEVQGIAGAIEDDLHDIGIGEFRGLANGMACGCHLCRAVSRQPCSNPPDQRRLDQWFIALHVHDDPVARIAPACDDLGDAIRARRVIFPGHYGGKPVTRDGFRNFVVVSGDQDLRCAACPRALCDTHDHRLAAQISERFAREPGRGVAGGDDYNELHNNDRRSMIDDLRTKSSTGFLGRFRRPRQDFRSSIIVLRSNFLLRRKFTSLVLEHHWNVFRDRVGQAAWLADQLGLGLLVNEGPFAQWADKYVEQSFIHILRYSLNDKW